MRTAGGMVWSACDREKAEFGKGSSVVAALRAPLQFITSMLPYFVPRSDITFVSLRACVLDRHSVPIFRPGFCFPPCSSHRGQLPVHSVSVEKPLRVL